MNIHMEPLMLEKFDQTIEDGSVFRKFHFERVFYEKVLKYSVTLEGGTTFYMVKDNHGQWGFEHSVTGIDDSLEAVFENYIILNESKQHSAS